MTFARKLHIWVCFAYLILLPVQFLLAGMGVFGGDLEVHQAFGGLLLHIVIPALLLITAGIGRMGWPQAGWSLLLFAIITLQIAMVEIGRNMDEPIVSGLHPAIALLTWPYVHFVVLGKARTRIARNGGADGDDSHGGGHGIDPIAPTAVAPVTP
ncbi:MAG: hypothetical protein JWM86_230 [Thermoleophilia bacterium]|nr:hypothetical protein [Thermoleophilia bacterium]